MFPHGNVPKSPILSVHIPARFTKGGPRLEGEFFFADFNSVIAYTFINNCV